MNAVKIAAIVLIVAGTLGLAAGSFSYTKETHEAKVGPIELSVKDRETVNVPVWAGVGAIVIGAALLLFARQDALGLRLRLPARLVGGLTARASSHGSHARPLEQEKCKAFMSAGLIAPRRTSPIANGWRRHLTSADQWKAVA